MIQRLFRSIRLRALSPNSFAKKEGVKFGKNCVFRTRFFGTEPYLIEIGDNFATAPNVHFITHDGGLHVIRNLKKEYRNIDLIKKIVIGNNVFIGLNTMILPGSVIGDNIVVGAGSIVKGVLESNSVYAGSPAKLICSIEEYFEKNKPDYDFVYGMELSEKKEYLDKKFRNQD
ncbi:MAG: acyltransferase [Algicola sp.]|nr:acyltransferase [Algicola sp.]